MFDVNQEGMEITLDGMGNMGTQIAKRGFYKAAAAAMEVFMEEVAERVPIKEGQLADALEYDIDVKDNRVLAVLGFNDEEQERIALWVEYGHAEKGHAPGYKDLGEVEQHPFLRPAFEAAQERATEAFSESIGETTESMAWSN